MTDPAQVEERRELERRAFGRDGSGLSPAEAARLTELRRPPAAAPSRGSPTDAAPRTLPPGPPSAATVRTLPPGSSSEDAGGALLPGSLSEDAGGTLLPGSLSEDAGGTVPPGSLSEDAGGTVLPGSLSEDAGGDRDETPPPHGPSPTRPPTRPLPAPIRAFRSWLATGRWKRPRYLLGGLALLLLLGVVIGVAIPRGPDFGIALRAGDGARRDAVLAAHDNFDPGSLVLLARSGEALLWTATSARGEVRCLLIDVAPAAPPAESDCRRADSLRDQPLQAVSAPPFPGAGELLHGSGATVTYAGFVLVSASGVPIGLLQRTEYYPQADRGLSDAEGLAAERIRREQNLAHVALAARWRGFVIWMGYTAQNEQCLIIEDPTTRSTCADPTLATGNPDPRTGQGLPLLSLEVHPSGDRPGATVEMWNPLSSAGYIVITETVNDWFGKPTA